ncbi:MAG: S9 family peptidase [Sphingopyxis sp.]|nr:S9 family peptidase [Sphingopyxis sp.]
MSLKQALFAGGLVLATPAALAQPLEYPATAKGDQVDTMFGARVADPYRWLENDIRKDPAVRDWIKAQNEVTMKYLAALPQRAAIEKRLEELWNYERYDLPVRKGSRYFFTRNTGLQDQAGLYVQDGLDAPARLLIDPNGWSGDGATALAYWMPSEDGKRLVYAVQEGGSDWITLRVLDVETGKVLEDRVEWIKFAPPAWNSEGTGFYYSRFPPPQRGAEFQSQAFNQAVYFHKVGTPQTDDVLIYATPEAPQQSHGAEVTRDGRWLIISTRLGTDRKTEVNVLDLADPAARMRTLFPGLIDSWSLVDSQGSRLFFVTDKGAPRYRLVSVDLGEPGTPVVSEVLPEAEGTITEASIVGNSLIVAYLEDAKSVVRRYMLDGTRKEDLALPGIGTAHGFAGDASSPETFYSYSSFNTPTVIYRYDATSGNSTIFKAPTVGFDPADYLVEQRFFASKDGTRIPMFVVSKKGVLAKGPAPTLLYGYGGFNASLTPEFSVARLAWLERGGVFVAANIRGGGEYGAPWHEAGILWKRQNVFDDFIGAGEALVKSGVTSPQQLAVMGTSNGGLLTATVVNQRPDLFAAALVDVGVLDMLRYDKFTAGRYWVGEFGDPADEGAFRNLFGYSPYHNIRGDRTYPAILVTTADTDDRVVPGHSFKYAAALQTANIGPKPHLIRIETRAGHGAGKPTSKQIEEFADQWAFIGLHTGLTDMPR